jgi:hypothetical protein
MSGTLIEDAANRGLERHSVYTLVLEDQKKVDEISGSRRAATLVGTRVGVQLFGDRRSNGTSSSSIGSNPSVLRSPGRRAD